MHFYDASESKLITVNLNSPRSNKLSCCNVEFPFSLLSLFIYFCAGKNNTVAGTAPRAFKVLLVGC